MFGLIAAIIGIVAGLTGIGSTIYSLVSKPSASGDSAAAAANTAAINKQLTAELSTDQGEITQLSTSEATLQKFVYVLLALAGCTVIYLLWKHEWRKK